MMANKACSAKHLIKLIQQIHQIVSSQALAHSLSPLIYKVISRIQDSPEMSQVFEDSLLKAELTFQECKLLWKKGLPEIALSSLDKKVIGSLKSNISRSDLSDKSRAEFKNLLGEALMTGGEWMSLRRAASAVDILDNYFKAATVAAMLPEVQIRAYLAFADFNTMLYQEASQRTESPEWQQSQKFNAARMLEVAECDKLYSQLKKSTDSKKENEEKIKTIARHRNILVRELESDKRERKVVEDSVSFYLLDALNAFAHILINSSDPEIETVFKVVR